MKTGVYQGSRRYEIEALIVLCMAKRGEAILTALKAAA